MTAAGPQSSLPGVFAGLDENRKGTEVLRTREKVVRVSGDWVIHTFLDDEGNALHSIGFRREPLFTEEDIEESQGEAELIDQ